MQGWEALYSLVESGWVGTIVRSGRQTPVVGGLVIDRSQFLSIVAVILFAHPALLFGKGPRCSGEAPTILW